MSIIENTQDTFTADREDIAANLSAGEPLTDFLVRATEASSETRVWAREYVEAVADLLPGHANRAAVDEVIDVLMSLKEDHLADATSEIGDSADYYGFDVQTLAFTAESATVVLAPKDDEALTEDIADELSDDIASTLSIHHGGHLTVVVAKVVAVTK